MSLLKQTRRFNVAVAITLLVAVSCKSTQTHTISSRVVENSRVLTEVSENSFVHKQHVVERDSVLAVSAPSEKSSTVGLQQSYLSTSLAHSFAEIDSAGKLRHTIENFDSIKSQVKYRYITDTVYIEKATLYTDTVKNIETSVNKEIVTVDRKKLTSWQSFQLWVGRIALIVLVISIIIKTNRKKIWHVQYKRLKKR